ncbi:hypothetical protein C8R44DRAFT_871424 [Mycena epipterygia]|nr:hypothetical protein C8R44DRAFT_871424 [Mycena epipterygia]
MHTLQPLDLSGLPFLTMFPHAEVLHSRKFVSAIRTVETLDLVLRATVDLSSFPSLKLLRISVSSFEARSSWQSIISTLATIPPSNHILKIIIVTNGYDPTPDDLAQLDSRLSQLHPPVVEFEMALRDNTRIMVDFPRSSSKNMVQRADPSPKWFRMDSISPSIVARSRFKLYIASTG